MRSWRSGSNRILSPLRDNWNRPKANIWAREAQLSYSEIRSPIDGVVTDRPLYPGEMAAAGTALLTVMDVSSVIAKAHIPQDDAAALKVGDKGTMTVPGIEEPIEGKVTVVSPALDPNSTTVEVWLEAKNPKQALKPGTSVQLSLTAQTVKDALVVPASSVITTPDGATAVMLAGTDGRAHQKAVKLGIRNGDDAQIVDGVTASDKVIATGAYGLPDKTKIKIESAQLRPKARLRDPQDRRLPVRGPVKNNRCGALREFTESWSRADLARVGLRSTPGQSSS